MIQRFFFYLCLVEDTAPVVSSHCGKFPIQTEISSSD